MEKKSWNSDPRRNRDGIGDKGDARKRGFPFVNSAGEGSSFDIDANKRYRKPSQSSEASSSCKSPDLESPSARLKCRLCNNKTSFKTSEEFDFHLSVIHYKDKLLDQLDLPPYKCRLCGFLPTAEDSSEEMVVHYGCKEKLAMKYYEEECRQLPTAVLNRSNSKSSRTTEVSSPFKNTIICKICNSSHDNERLFVRHITLRHFSSDLRKLLPQREPFNCPFRDCKQWKDDQHSLILHYGLEHNISMELYMKHINDHQPKKMPTTTQQSGHDDDELFIIRDSTRNNKPTTAAASVDLQTPKIIKSVTEVDMFKPTQKFSASITCKLCTERKTTFVTPKSLKYHLLLTHFFPDLVKSSPMKCPTCTLVFKVKNEFAKHFVDLHFDQYMKDKQRDKNRNDRKSHDKDEKQKEGQQQQPKSLNKSLTEELPTPLKRVSKNSSSSNSNDFPLPKIREMKTVHGPDRGQQSSARQRMLDRWKSTSIDSHKIDFDQLQEKTEKMQEDHAVALRQKAEEFERWIGQKELAIEEETDKRTSVENNLEVAKVEIANLKKQLEQKNHKIHSLEEVVVEEHDRNVELAKQKKEVEKRLATRELLGKELTDFHSFIEKMKTGSKEMKQELSAKTEELNELQEQHQQLISSGDKQVAKLAKQIENLKGKNDKLTEEKKAKMAHIKDITKMHKDLETDQRNQMNQLTQEKKDLKKECAKLSMVDVKVKELEESEIATKMTALEKENKTNENEIQVLENQRNALLDSLDRLQKMVYGFETVIKNTNEKLQDETRKLEENEINLEEALEKLLSSKESEKERKDAQKQVKQLQSTLKDWETRQFSNVKLISGLQKEKAALEKKLKDFEENSTGADDEVYQMSTKVKRLEKDLKLAKEAKDHSEQEQAKTQALLASKSTELASLKLSASLSDAKIRNLEKDLRAGRSQIGQQGTVSEEYEELRKNFSTLADRYNKLKSDLVCAQAQLKVKLDDTKPADTSSKDNTIETLKMVAKNSQMKLSKKEKEVERLKFLLQAAQASSVRQEHNNYMLEIKKEPLEETNVESVDTERQIILNIPNQNDLLADNSSCPTDSPAALEDPYDMSVDVEGSTSCSDHDLNGTLGSSVSKTSSSSAGKRKASKPPIVDVTSQFAGEPDDDITCGICKCWDPPLPSIETTDTSATIKKKKETYTTSWVGCDCGQWYHKQCTGRKRFTCAFSCKSVKRKCLKAKNAPKDTTDHNESKDPLLELNVTPDIILP
jgi:uncharacterized C2H2 Zn-finger protein